MTFTEQEQIRQPAKNLKSDVQLGPITKIITYNEDEQSNFGLHRKRKPISPVSEDEVPQNPAAEEEQCCINHD